ncbi:MAG TPA: preprotein translocase subunit YajC [Lacipirellulaceae bacterium]|nr:preprotein translocase subunit YajC [Lacipirellulaceae bacterium]
MLGSVAPLPASILQIAIFAADQPAAQEDPYQLVRLIAMVGGIMALFYFMMIRPQKRKEQDLRDQVANLKENDRVVTIGGIYGVVTNVQRDAQRITVRVDESTGTKLRLNMSAIARVLTAEEQEGGTTTKAS